MPKTADKKIQQTETEQPKKAPPPPEKPESEVETRLYQVTVTGTDPITGKPNVAGTEKRWLTKKEAKAHGFPWAD